MSLIERLAGAGGRLVPHTTQVEGLRFAWGETGAGPPIVLVHGLAASGWWWERNLSALGARHRLLVVDLAGFGASRRQPFRLATAGARLGRWLEAVGAGPAAVVGHSLGGYVAADLAAARPDLVDRLVLVDAAALPLEGPVRGHVRNLLRGGGRSERALVRIAIVDIARAGPIVIVGAARQLLASDLSARLAAITAPTLVVWGEEDALILPSQGRRLAGVIPGARFASIPGAGHAPMWERPELFDPLVLDFLGAMRQSPR
ncbi:MAG TPA: alpha/beta fold hydrolase [Candidatus Limnocylindrales bacterium]|nr:alpha/beta fold hydrolase [Candidatus Limnocylindrales bacterium]